VSEDGDVMVMVVQVQHQLEDDLPEFLGYTP
jgi:hypothetical protein